MCKGVSVVRHDPRIVAEKFVRTNPKSDLFPVKKFHHVEFWCPDATNAYKRFQQGLGMELVAKSDQTTGNSEFGSYVLKSEDLVFAFTAPYASSSLDSRKRVHPKYDPSDAFRFVNTHGFGVRAVGIEVEDAEAAFDISVRHGAIPMTPPTRSLNEESGKKQIFSEVFLYGDTILRYVSGDYDGPYLAPYITVEGSSSRNYGLRRLDHAVGNVHKLKETADYITQFTGFHEFAEFTTEDVGTVESGLNSVVLASNNEYVLLPINEPTFGTKRRSQIQTYLEQNKGPGVQHLALKTDDMFTTISRMRSVSDMGGFEFMPRPSDDYFRTMPDRIGDSLTPEQYKMVQELGILVDKDDQGLLMQIFTKPVSDRATFFLEIIQRVGCEINGNGMEHQKGGCGGFGKGNFRELFRSIENYERMLTD